LPEKKGFFQKIGYLRAIRLPFFDKRFPLTPVFERPAIKSRAIPPKQCKNRRTNGFKVAGSSKQMWHIAADRLGMQKVLEQCNSLAVGGTARQLRTTRLR
jgi:hypothetical protein